MATVTNNAEMVVLVDEHDRELGIMGKLEAHQTGTLHRAFSVFLFDNKGRLLLQQRASGKYHSAGLWTNTCCSHPRPGEELGAAAVRRLKEEMGMTAELSERFTFTYRAEMENGLVEHEFDHVFFGYSNDRPEPDPNEVANSRHVSMEDLAMELAKAPERFTAWIKACMPLLVKELEAKGA